MKKNNDKQNEILLNAEKLHHYLNLMIAQSESWLSEEKETKKQKAESRKQKAINN